MNFNIFNSLILIGIIQGFVFGTVVAFSKKYKTASTRLLAMLIVVFSLNELQYYLVDTTIIDEEFFFSVVFIPYQLLAAPLLLYYGLTLIYPDKKISRRSKWVMLPFGIGLILTTAYKILFASSFQPESVDLFFDPFEGLIEFSSIILYQSVLMHLFNQLSQIQNQKQNSEKISSRNGSLKWFRTIITVFFGLSFIWLCVAVLSYVYDFDYLYYVVWIALSIMTYWLGYTGIYKYGKQLEQNNIINDSLEPKSNLTQKQKSGHIQALELSIINDKRYLDPNLTLDQLASELNVTKSHLSRLFNSEFHVGFPDYINSLRIEEAKSHLLNPDFANYTLIAIGLEAGFNSKTTFYNAFKKVTGLTPLQYKKTEN